MLICPVVKTEHCASHFGRIFQGRQLPATLLAGLETVLPAIVVYGFSAREPSDPQSGPEQLVRSKNFRVLILLCLVCGGLLTLIYFFYSVATQRKKENHDFSNKRLLSVLGQSADERGTSQMKRGECRKVSRQFLFKSSKTNFVVA